MLRNIYDDAKQFNKEADDTKIKIYEIEEMSKLIKCKTSAANEVDAFKSRWQELKLLQSNGHRRWKFL